MKKILLALLPVLCGCTTTNVTTCASNDDSADYSPMQSCTVPSKPNKNVPERIDAARPAGKRLNGIKSLPLALETAKKENKLLLIQYGREACSNCQKVWTMLGCGMIKLPKNMIYADVDCDDYEVIRFFYENYIINDAGLYLPFLIIADQDGRQISSISGLHAPEEYQKLIDKACEDYKDE